MFVGFDYTPCNKIWGALRFIILLGALVPPVKTYATISRECRKDQLHPGLVQNNVPKQKPYRRGHSRAISAVRGPVVIPHIKKNYPWSCPHSPGATMTNTSHASCLTHEPCVPACQQPSLDHVPPRPWGTRLPLHASWCDASDPLPPFFPLSSSRSEESHPPYC